MTNSPTISQTLIDWCDIIYSQEHPRSQSWQHCYGFFQRVGQAGLVNQRDLAALHLGFYLASWGMYRGSGFLLKHSHTLHYDAVDVLADPIVTPLWNSKDPPEPELLRTNEILNAIQAIRDAYRPFGKPSDTLVTKVLLGTVACIPATDRFFIAGFKKQGYAFTSVTAKFIDCVYSFWRDNESELRAIRDTIQQKYGVCYPPLVLVDMYFNRLGFASGTSELLKTA